MPMGYAALMKTGWVDWGYHTEPQAGMGGRRLYCPRGKVLGGSSSVNAMIYIRGVPSDYDMWAQLGNRGWAWDKVLPYFKKAETYWQGADNYHGGDGPLKVSRPGVVHPLNAAWIEAGREAGYPYTADFNGAQQEGFGPLDCTIAAAAAPAPPSAICGQQRASEPHSNHQGAGHASSCAARSRGRR